MREVVNLRQARKRKRRAEKARIAAENRLTKGQPTAGKTAARRAQALAEKRLDGHRLEPDPQS
jgi:hypothetical protein